MLNGITTWRRATIAASAVACLSLPTMSAAPAQPQASHKAMYEHLQRERAKGQPALQNFAPPEFGPDYTGSNGG